MKRKIREWASVVDVHVRAAPARALAIAPYQHQCSDGNLISDPSSKILKLYQADLIGHLSTGLYGTVSWE
ncbi:unnamed protein product [Victoria cruziana]